MGQIHAFKGAKIKKTPSEGSLFDLNFECLKEAGNGESLYFYFLSL